MFVCCECGRKFKTARAAERAANNGCPKCGGVDIDLDAPLPPQTADERFKEPMGFAATRACENSGM